MFKLKPDPTFWATVSLSQPGGEEVEVEMEFKAATTSQVNTWKDREFADIVRDQLIGWRGMDAPFSSTALGELLENYPGAAAQIYRDYLSGLVGAKRKN